MTSPKVAGWSCLPIPCKAGQLGTASKGQCTENTVVRGPAASVAIISTQRPKHLAEAPILRRRHD